MREGAGCNSRTAVVVSDAADPVSTVLHSFDSDLGLALQHDQQEMVMVVEGRPVGDAWEEAWEEGHQVSVVKDQILSASSSSFSFSSLLPR